MPRTPRRRRAPRKWPASTTRASYFVSNNGSVMNGRRTAEQNQTTIKLMLRTHHTRLNSCATLYPCCRRGWVGVRPWMGVVVRPDANIATVERVRDTARPSHMVVRQHGGEMESVCEEKGAFRSFGEKKWWGGARDGLKNVNSSDATFTIIVDDQLLLVRFGFSARSKTLLYLNLSKILFRYKT